MKRRLLYLAAAALYLLHQDVWLWDDASLLLGAIPAGFAYHVAYCLAASLLLGALVRSAWPPGLEGGEDAERAGAREAPWR